VGRVPAAHVERWNAAVDRGMSTLQAEISTKLTSASRGLTDAENDPDVLNALR
jgi:hypothetical protein